MLFKYSLSRNNQPLTRTALADFGFYSKHGVFSVRCKLNVMQNANLQSVNVTRTSYIIITPWYQTGSNNANKTHCWGFLNVQFRWNIIIRPAVTFHHRYDRSYTIKCSQTVWTDLRAAQRYFTLSVRKKVSLPVQQSKFSDFNSNITNPSFPHSMSRSTAVITTFRTRPKLHRCLHFVPLIYPTVMMIEEVHMPRSLSRLNSINSTFTSYLTEMDAKKCFAQQV